MTKTQVSGPRARRAGTSPSRAGVWLFCAALASILPLAGHGAWSLHEVSNDQMPGKSLEVRQHGQQVASLVFGEGQIKPYLHVYGEGGDVLTRWSGDQMYPHHRGIFIGWSVASDLGTVDLWHLGAGGKMELLNFETLKTAADSATIVATIAWRAARADAGGNDLLIREKRTLTISRPQGQETQVDAHFSLQAARPLSLTGDLQHAGVHFRAAAEVVDRKDETSYLSEPPDAAQGSDLKWCRFLFPIGDRWYSVLQLNAPSNPVEELSMRDYGRFGYFFKRQIAAGEKLEIAYRFITARAEAPANKARLSSEQAESARKQAEERYRTFADELGKTAPAGSR